MSAEESSSSSSSTDESSERNPSFKSVEGGVHEERFASLKLDDEIDVEESASDRVSLKDDRGGLSIVEKDEVELEEGNSLQMDDGIGVGVVEMEVGIEEVEGVGSNAGGENGVEILNAVDDVLILRDDETVENEMVLVDSRPGLEVKTEWTRSRTRSNSEVEVDERSSPSSSGYAGEQGSSNCAASSASDINEIVDDGEIREIRNDENGGQDSQVDWVPGKRHVNEVRNFYDECWSMLRFMSRVFLVITLKLGV